MTSTPYTWVAPGGMYVVPAAFKAQFLAEFPEYRIRWSIRESKWQVEQSYGRGALPPLRISEDDDSLIRARDGYWLVMSFQPGDRMACRGIISTNPVQRCGCTIKVPHRKTAEVRCGVCMSKGRDGRTLCAFWPFDESLLQHLRRTDPLRDGTRRASRDVDAANLARAAEIDRRTADQSTLDYVDLRWATGIAASSGLSRHVDDTTFR